MGFRIKANDIMVEVDTLDEARGILAMLGALEGKIKHPSVPKESGSAVSLPFISEVPTTATQLSNFYRNLIPGHTRTMIQALYDKPEGLTSEELKKILGLDGSAFGGALGGITKATKPHGLKSEDVVSKPKEGENHFRLTPPMREVIQAEKEKPKRIPYTS